MAAPSRQPAEIKARPSRKASLRLAGDEDQASPSPALRMQESLHEQWAESGRRAAEPAKWSQRRTLAFVALTCGGFWTCVILGVARLAH